MKITATLTASSQKPVQEISGELQACCKKPLGTIIVKTIQNS